MMKGKTHIRAGDYTRVLILRVPLHALGSAAVLRGLSESEHLIGFSEIPVFEEIIVKIIWLLMVYPYVLTLPPYSSSKMQIHTKQ